VILEVVGSNPTIHLNAQVGELVDPLHLGCSVERRVSSSLTLSTIAWLVQLNRTYDYGS